MFKSIFSRNWPYARIAMPIYNGTLDQNVEDNVVFLIRKWLFLWVSSLFLVSKKCASHFCRETTNENKPKHECLINTSSDKAFNEIMLDMASLKYTFTDPVIRKNHAHTIIFYVWMSQKSFFFTGFFYIWKTLRRVICVYYQQMRYLCVIIFFYVFS